MGDVTVNNVSSEVYEIFNVTGFTEILNVKKALREVSIEGCEMIGAGGYGSVYRIDAETIVKVYHNASLEFIEKERELSKRAFLLGVPTAISFDTVKVGEQYGVVYEICDDIHNRDGKFIVMSVNLPYDVARFQKADAIMLVYLAVSMPVDPEDKTKEMQKYGANMPVALYMMFSNEDAPTAKLPVNIPQLDEDYSYTDTMLYERGFGLTYTAEDPKEIMAEHTSIDWDRSGNSIVIRTNSESETVAIRIGGGLAGTDETEGVTLENGTVTLSGEFANKILEDGENTLRLVFSDGEIEISIFVTNTEKNNEPSNTSEPEDSDNSAVSDKTSEPEKSDLSESTDTNDNTNKSGSINTNDNNNTPGTGDAYPFVIMLSVIVSCCIAVFAARKHTEK